jgi:hypothetical protein
LEDEQPTVEEVTVTDSSHPVPIPLLRDGEFFIVETTELERSTIHVVVATASGKIERTLVISGYVASQVPCDRRTVYLAKRPFYITKQTIAMARRYLNDVTHCASIDKALVAWEEIRGSTDSIKTAGKRFDGIGDLIDYNWARGNYQSCISLGYEQQCEIGEAAFKDLSNIDLAKINVNAHEKVKVMTDINSMPLQIAYSRLRTHFGLRDWLTAGQEAEKLLDDFDKKSEYWEHINISKTRLHVDAAVSWLHYADSLSSIIMPQEADMRCNALRKALFHAQNAWWYNFRQEHVPAIEGRMRSCAS